MVDRVDETFNWDDLEEIEQRLMNDDHIGDDDSLFAADFLSDLLVDSPVNSPSAEATGFPHSKVSSGSEVDDDKVKLNDGAEDDNPYVGGFDSQFAADFFSDLPVNSPVESLSAEATGFPHSKVSSGSEVDDEDKYKNKVELNDGAENEDPLDKKRKRQLRNRDAAVRSRERKKLYVRDLELKSRYFESECKRLAFVLQCCLAENQALRFSLQNSGANGACMTKQESAVLLLESLLLGSLLWFLGITCLLILPSQPWSIPEENQQSGNHGLLVPIKGSKKTSRILVFPSAMMGKRCKASRSRMKCDPLCLRIVM